MSFSWHFPSNIGPWQFKKVQIWRQFKYPRPGYNSAGDGGPVINWRQQMKADKSKQAAVVAGTVPSDFSSILLLPFAGRTSLAGWRHCFESQPVIFRPASTTHSPPPALQLSFIRQTQHEKGPIYASVSGFLFNVAPVSVSVAGSLLGVIKFLGLLIPWVIAARIKESEQDSPRAITKFTVDCT